MKKLNTLLALVTLSASLHSFVFSMDAKSNQYFPVGTGDSWTYKNVGKNFTWTIEVVGGRTINEKEYFIFKRSFENNAYSDSSFYRVDDGGKVFINYFEKDFLLIDFNLGKGAEWQSYGAFKAGIPNTDEVVLVPAGNFTNCIEVLFDMPVTQGPERVCKYAPGVGLVEYKTADGLSKLISANVDGVSYPIQKHLITSKIIE